jgi:hypothetical protein
MCGTLIAADWQDPTAVDEAAAPFTWRWLTP